MVLVEAIILGKAVISTDCPNGPSEVLMQGQCGRLVKIGDINGLATVMQQLLRNTDICASLINQANANLKRFDIEKNLALLEQILLPIPTIRDKAC